MRLELWIVVIGLLIFVGLFSIAYSIGIRVVNLRKRMEADPSTDEATDKGWRAVLERTAHFFQPIAEAIPRSPEEMSRLEQRLTQAGMRRRDRAILFVGMQVGMALMIFFLLGISPFMRHHFFLHLIVSLFLGPLIPDIALRQIIVRRQERIQLALPDVLDLTVVCVEAGLGLDQSMLRIGQEIRLSHPDLSDEMRLTNLEMNMGRARADVLRNLGGRTGVDDLKALCAVLIQTDRFGTSVGQALRVYSDSLRVRRRQRAEEKAAKIPVKMIAPMVVFIFPAVFVVIVGPAVIGIIRDFVPLMLAR